jgi:hypothetical protein
MIAAAQADAHRARLTRYEEVEQTLGEADVSEGFRLALQVGLMHEREFVAFWEALAEAT